MRKQYEEPNMLIKMYNLALSEYVTTSDLDPDENDGTDTDPDLNDKDHHDYFG